MYILYFNLTIHYFLILLKDYIYKTKFINNENEFDIEINNNKEEIVISENKIRLNKLCDEYIYTCKFIYLIFHFF